MKQLLERALEEATRERAAREQRLTNEPQQIELTNEIDSLVIMEQSLQTAIEAADSIYPDSRGGNKVLKLAVGMKVRLTYKPRAGWFSQMSGYLGRVVTISHIYTNLFEVEEDKDEAKWLFDKNDIVEVISEKTD